MKNWKRNANLERERKRERECGVGERNEEVKAVLFGLFGWLRCCGLV